MSNKNQPHHKFVQTFVLAEQPNGYFVLNDIFRYLNEDEDEIVEDEIPAEVPAEEPSTPAEAGVEPPTEELVVTETAAEQVDEKLVEETAAEPEVEEPVNGVSTGADEPEPVVAEAQAPEPEIEEAKETTPEPVTEEAPEPEPTVVAPPKAPEPVPETQPAKPKTWASMLGGSKPAVPALPVQQPAPSQPRAQKPAVTPAVPRATPAEPAAASPSPTPSNGWQEAGHGKKGRGTAQPKVEANALAYIKNVNEKVDARLLREALEKYGELKYFDVSRPRVSSLFSSQPTSC